MNNSNLLKPTQKAFRLTIPPPDNVFDHVKAEIGDKKFILIGEFNYGSKEVFLVRNELINSSFGS